MMITYNHSKKYDNFKFTKIREYSDSVGYINLVSERRKGKHKDIYTIFKWTEPAVIGTCRNKGVYNLSEIFACGGSSFTRYAQFQYHLGFSQ
jgi:hypothetical protein